MNSTDVVSIDANLLAVVNGQHVKLERMSSVNRLFSSSKLGQMAKASIDSDGQVLGLFQHGRHMHRVMPLERMDEAAPPTLLETTGRLHHVRVLDFSDQEEGEEEQQQQQQQEGEHKKEEEQEG